MPEQLNSFFLSYSRSDERTALRLAKDLRERGIAMWVDQIDIRPSEHWDRAIERAVGFCRGLVVIVSPRSVASDNVADEISFAIDNGKSVLPVMIERCSLPLRLTRMQVVDATGSYDRALQQCFEELTRRSADPKSSTPAASASAREQLDATELAKAKQRLAEFVGPIAGRLVDKSAIRANSATELYAMLAQHIDDEVERARFAAHASVPMSPPAGRPTAPQSAPPASIEPSELESMTRLMVQHIGPIGAIVVKRESRNAANLLQLRQQLASHIPDEGQRANFMRDTQPR